MNYENMTVFEINKAVAETDKKFNSCIDVEFFMSDSNEKAVDVVSQGLLICTVDYCNDWAYGGLIIQSKKISIEYDKSHNTWTAHQGDYLMGKYITNCRYRHQYESKNPLRAAMIVYLMMNGKQEVK